MIHYDGLRSETPIREYEKTGPKKEIPGNRLPCFTENDWIEWWRLNVEHPSSRPYPCNDCTPVYQARMKNEGKCKHPDVIFVWRKRKALDGGGRIIARFEELKGVIDPWPDDILARSDETGGVTGMRNYKELCVV